jgi:HPt (histidine-containing phosphotransfer) domain-containing protein
MTIDLWLSLPDSLNTKTLKTLADDTSLPTLASLLMDFSGELKSQHHLIAGFYETEDLNAIAEILHTMKGLAATFGADALHRTAQDLEGLAREGELAAVSADIQTLFVAITQANADMDVAQKLIQNDVDRQTNDN